MGWWILVERALELFNLKTIILLVNIFLFSSSVRWSTYRLGVMFFSGVYPVYNAILCSTSYILTGISLDIFSLGNHRANQSRLIPVTVNPFTSWKVVTDSCKWISACNNHCRAKKKLKDDYEKHSFTSLNDWRSTFFRSNPKTVMTGMLWYSFNW